MDTVDARVVEATLKYEALFTAPIFPLFDQPGRIYDALLSKLKTFGAVVTELTNDNNRPAESAIVCSLQIGANVTLRPGRLEVAVPEWAFPQIDQPSRLIESAWQALVSVQSVTASVQTAAFEFELELPHQAYRSALERFAPAPAALPGGTETGVVFYLPPDPEKGFRPSSVFLDRSSVDGGMSCFGTLVYDGAALEPAAVLRVAWQRMSEILDKLDIMIGR
jgi:hypothetical protein